MSAAGEISLSVDKQPTASGGDYGEQLDIISFSTNPHDVEDTDQLGVLVQVEPEQAVAGAEHGLAEP